MGTSHEIKCINKSDGTNIHERILNIGGINNDGTRWKITETEAISGIEEGKWNFYVSNGISKVNVIIAKSASGFKYLKTEAFKSCIFISEFLYSDINDWISSIIFSKWRLSTIIAILGLLRS